MRKKSKQCHNKHTLRPRTAYNFFYKHQRSVILGEKTKTAANKQKMINYNSNTDDSTGRITLIKRPQGKSYGPKSLRQLTKAVAKQWKEASIETRREFEILADKDKVRYTKEIMSSRKSGPELSSHDLSFDDDNDASIANQMQCLDDYRTGGNKDYLLNVVEYLKDNNSVDIFSHSSTRSNSSQHYYTDKLGIKWSEGELDVLKLLT